MSPGGGISTLSITWMIPFDVCTSAPVTVASPTVTLPSVPTAKVALSPLTIVTASPSVTAAGWHGSCVYVIQ